MRKIKAIEDYPYIGYFSAHIIDEILVSRCIYYAHDFPLEETKTAIYKKILQDVIINNSKSATIGLFFTRHFCQE